MEAYPRLLTQTDEHEYILTMRLLKKVKDFTSEGYTRTYEGYTECSGKKYCLLTQK